MSAEWSMFPHEMLRVKVQTDTFRDTLDDEGKKRFDEALRRFSGLGPIALLDDGLIRRVLAQVEAEAEQELRFRRTWAEKIRKEFSGYHDHGDGGECGACGAINGANWMDPDYTKDGPR